MSDMFLDTELDEADFNRIAATLAASPYSLDELDDILWAEVYPACYGNLLLSAGEWAGFDPAWLESRIMRGPSLFTRLWPKTLGHRILTWRSWGTIRRRVDAARRT
jgi:hypothetical protein